ncbi:UNVERIFIED_CONTAM: GPI mannosyltransferase 2, partial [Sesamum radiatum]
MTLKSVAATTPHRRSCPYTRRLLLYAVASRVFVLTLIIIWRSLVSPYDTSASINPPCLTSSTDSGNRHRSSVLLPSVGSVIENSIVWDSVYFIRIAECGYEYEQTYAFLPLLPLCISFLSKTAFGYFNICMGRSAAEMRPWCKARLPLLYNYIQSHYWGVGFLRYFRVKQLPNFLLASPILSVAFCSIVYYVKLWPEVFLSLGLGASSLQKEFVGSPLSKTAEGQPITDGLLENDSSNLLQ